MHTVTSDGTRLCSAAVLQGPIVKYQHIYEDADITMGIFLLPKVISCTHSADVRWDIS